MTEHVETPAQDTASALRPALIKGQWTNPALQRLQARLLSHVDASEVITSYDRMHHRHSRS